MQKFLLLTIILLFAGCSSYTKMPKEKELQVALKSGIYDISFASSFGITEEQFNWLRNTSDEIKKSSEDNVLHDFDGCYIRNFTDNDKVYYIDCPPLFAILIPH